MDLICRFLRNLNAQSHLAPARHAVASAEEVAKVEAPRRRINSHLFSRRQGVLTVAVTLSHSAVRRARSRDTAERSRLIAVAWPPGV
jgi:hypothetical protein